MNFNEGEQMYFTIPEKKIAIEISAIRFLVNGVVGIDLGDEFMKFKLDTEEEADRLFEALSSYKSNGGAKT